MDTIQYFVKDKLQCFIYEDREKMGQCAARDIIAAMHVMLSQKETINMMFGAAPSQNEVLAALAADTTIDWTRVNAFHMDEYIGPQRASVFSSTVSLCKLYFSGSL